MNSVLGSGVMFAGMLVIGTGCAVQPSPGSCPQELAGAACESAGSAGGPQQVGDDQGQAASDPEAAPADTDTDAPPAAGAYSQYIAFGDSFTSGFGLDGTFTFDDGGIALLDSNPCARSDLAWPPLVSTLLNVPNPLIFAACSGATTLDIVGNGRLVQNMTQPGPQIAQLPPSDQLDSALITVQIGGNDLRLDDSFQQCSNGLSSMTSTNLTGSPTSPNEPSCANLVGSLISLSQLSPNCANLDSLLQNFNTAVDSTLGPNLHAAFSALQAAAPNATIVAVGYPHLVDANSDCSGLWACLPIGYRQQMNALADAINAKIESEANDAGIFSITDDIVTAFTGHEMCSPQEMIDSFNVHPNVAGHQLYAQVVANGVSPPQ